MEPTVDVISFPLEIMVFTMNDTRKNNLSGVNSVICFIVATIFFAFLIVLILSRKPLVPVWLLTYLFGTTTLIWSLYRWRLTQDWNEF